MLGPNSTFTDPERIQLITRISGTMQNVNKFNSETTFRTVWACLWLADLDRLHVLAAKIPDHLDILADILKLLEH